MKGLLRKDLALVAVNAKTYLVVLFFVQSGCLQL